MIGIRAFVVCVNYCDLLRITLPRNIKHMDECLVITSPEDFETKEFCATIPNVKVFETDAFTRYGAKFNKALAIELALEEYGRHGWMLGWDADTLFPDDMGDYVKVEDLNPTMLYGAPRRILKDPSQWTPAFDWNTACRTLDRCWPGFFHLFHADDPHIAELPWYDLTFAHAGGGDGYFESRWPRSEKAKFPFCVLHLGERDANWFGRTTKRADGKEVEGAEERRRVMDEFLASKGWGRKWNGKSFNDRVDVPGAERKFRLLGGADT